MTRSSRQKLAGGLAITAVLLGSGGALQAGEFQINEYTSSYQQRPAIQAVPAGFLVVWDSAGQDDAALGIFGRTLDPDGAYLGTEFQINTFTTGSQAYPDAAANGDGSFVVVWTSIGQGSAYEVYGQRFESSGSPSGGEFRVNSFTDLYQEASRVALGSSGDFVVVWESGPGFIFPPNFGQDGSGRGVFAQRFASDGAALGGEFQVNATTIGDQDDPDVALAGDGSFLVVWRALNPIGVFGQLFDDSGSAVGAEFQVNGYTSGFPVYPRVTSTAGGRFVVSWSDAGDVFSRIIDDTGLPLGEDLQINTYTSSSHRAVVISAPASNATGEHLATWVFGNGGVRARWLSGDGLPIGSDFAVGGNAGHSYLAPTASVGVHESGRALIGWTSSSVDGSDSGIAGEILASPTFIFADGFESGDASSWSAAIP